MTIFYGACVLVMIALVVIGIMAWRDAQRSQRVINREVASLQQQSSQLTARAKRLGARSTA